MVNNAGVDAVTPILEIDEDELSKLFNINVFGTLFGIQAAANQFIKQKVKVKSSTHVVLQDMNLMKYSALTQQQNTQYVPLLKQLLKELADKGITVNAYCPGVAKTEMWDRIDEEMVKLDDSLEIGDAFEAFSSEIKLGRYQEPSDVANLVSFLASNDSDYITGQSILTDGGLVYR